jgi:hypothetical protein
MSNMRLIYHHHLYDLEEELYMIDDMRYVYRKRTFSGDWGSIGVVSSLQSDTITYLDLNDIRDVKTYIRIFNAALNRLFDEIELNIHSCTESNDRKQNMDRDLISLIKKEDKTNAG